MSAAFALEPLEHEVAALAFTKASTKFPAPQTETGPSGTAIPLRRMRNA
jgi:hypothetical protein